MVLPIDSQTVAVETAADLNSVVSVNSAILYVYLAQNITLTGGISIHTNRTSLTIDGEYLGVRHSLTDVNDSDAAHTLGIFGTSGIALILKNMDIYGRNYFGVPYVASSFWPLDTSRVSVTYENVTYTGSQLTYNRYGLTRYIDCDITITQIGASVAEEVGEVCRVELGGRTTITHTSTDDAVFWFNNTSGNSSLTVLTGAEVSIVSQNSYFMYNYDLLIQAPVSYILEPGARLDLTVNKGISFQQAHSVNTFTVGDGAAFRYIQTGSNDNWSSLYITGSLQVGQGADFYMQAENGSEPLICFPSGSPRLTVSDPHSFVLYCVNDPALLSLVATQISLTGGQVNTWSAATVPVSAAGTLDDLPQYKWFKSQYASPVVITGSFTQNATSAVSNLTTEDEPHPGNGDLHLNSLRVLSIGDFPFTVNSIENDGRPISGTTEAAARVRAVYSTDGTSHTLNGTAGADGGFSLDTTGEAPADIPADTPVTVYSNIPFLIKSIAAVSIDAGELYIESAPLRIPYSVNALTTSPLLLPRVGAEVPVVVVDIRADQSRWNLLASVPEPLQAEDGHMINDAVVFRYFNAVSDPVLVTLGPTPVVVHTGGPGVERTNVVWNDENEGILLRIGEPLHLGFEYTADVVWTVEAAGG